MIGPVSRILARYLAGALVAYGLFSAPDVAALEPDLVAVVGAILGAAVEAAYAFAKRRGWAT
jgi:hypothetical protein